MPITPEINQITADFGKLFLIEDQINAFDAYQMSILYPATKMLEPKQSDVKYNQLYLEILIKHKGSFNLNTSFVLKASYEFPINLFIEDLIKVYNKEASQLIC